MHCLADKGESEEEEIPHTNSLGCQLVCSANNIQEWRMTVLVGKEAKTWGVLLQSVRVLSLPGSLPPRSKGPHDDNKQMKLRKGRRRLLLTPVRESC
jgi:hypothetical protein